VTTAAHDDDAFTGAASAGSRSQPTLVRRLQAAAESPVTAAPLIDSRSPASRALEQPGHCLPRRQVTRLRSSTCPPAVRNSSLALPRCEEDPQGGRHTGAPERETSIPAQAGAGGAAGTRHVLGRAVAPMEALEVCSWPFSTTRARPRRAFQSGAVSAASPCAGPALKRGRCHKARRQVPGSRSSRRSQRSWSQARCARPPSSG
jgi:hypothetical protein